MTTPSHLFTVGHSILSLPAFLELLRPCEVQLLVDVRSRPVSVRSPHFSQPEFELSLRDAGLRYLFLGEGLGGRPDDPKAYRADGLVDYRERRRSYAVRAGVDRIQQELGQGPLALMCAEEDPLECHRFLMICPELVQSGIEPRHIRKAGILESQREVEDRLLEAQHFGAVSGPTLFSSDRAAALEDAYVAQAQKCAFRADPQTIGYW